MAILITVKNVANACDEYLISLLVCNLLIIIIYGSLKSFYPYASLYIIIICCDQETLFFAFRSLCLSSAASQKANETQFFAQNKRLFLDAYHNIW